MKEFNEIAKIIKDYGTHGKDQDVQTLLNIQDRLVSAGFWLAGFVGDLKTDYNQSYFIRKLTISKRKQAIINEGKSAAAAEAEATNESEEIYKKELEAEANAYKADLLLKQLNKVLSAIQQRISYLKLQDDYTK